LPDSTLQRRLLRSTLTPIARPRKLEDGQKSSLRLQLSEMWPPVCGDFFSVQYISSLFTTAIVAGLFARACKDIGVVELLVQDLSPQKTLQNKASFFLALIAHWARSQIPGRSSNHRLLRRERWPSPAVRFRVLSVFPTSESPQTRSHRVPRMLAYAALETSWCRVSDTHNTLRF